MLTPDPMTRPSPSSSRLPSSSASTSTATVRRSTCRCDRSARRSSSTAWWGLTTIPYGETVSYGEQARRLGHDGKARAVGAANGRNPLPIVMPCHRVVGSDGSLVGFGGGLATKAWLLHHERQVLGLELPLS